MTDAFKCNGCGEFFDYRYRFVEIEMNTDSMSFSDFTIDDIGAGAFGVLPQKQEAGRYSGDFCVECGRNIISDLMEKYTDD